MPMNRRPCPRCKGWHVTGEPCPGKTPAKPKLPRWYAKDIGTGYYLENGERNFQTSTAHCLACALTSAILQHGGDCDLRGLYRYGNCFSFLQALVNSERKGEPHPESED